LSLLDEAGEVLAAHGFEPWHADWAKARVSRFPTTGWAYITRNEKGKGPKWRRYRYDESVQLPERGAIFATPVPVRPPPWTPPSVENLNVCGGCFARFTGANPQASAEALLEHIEHDPCPHYAAVTGKQREC
jgi:hypothetical protein